MPLRCVVTAGPTYEPLDRVRRLTNFSTGRLGSTLAARLAEDGHEVVLFLGAMSVHRAIFPSNCHVLEYSTGADLARQLEALSTQPVAAVFHAAAVSDFTFGKIWMRNRDGGLEEVAAGKVSSEEGVLHAELLPTPKILGRLRGWFPESLVVGWKYEVDGNRSSAIEKGRQQIAANRTDGCAVNGPAFGDGFGLLPQRGETRFLTDSGQLCALLSKWVLTFDPPSRSREG